MSTSPFSHQTILEKRKVFRNYGANAEFGTGTGTNVACRIGTEFDTVMGTFYFQIKFTI